MMLGIDRRGMCEEIRLHLLIIVKVDRRDQVAADSIPRVLTVEQFRRSCRAQHTECGVNGLLHRQHDWRLALLQVNCHARPDHVRRIVRQLQTSTSTMMRYYYYYYYY